jgi:hypothetical protein
MISVAGARVQADPDDATAIFGSTPSAVKPVAVTPIVAVVVEIFFYCIIAVISEPHISTLGPPPPNSCIGGLPARRLDHPSVSGSEY